MTLILKGCRRCGGDLALEALDGYSFTCVQCGREAPPSAPGRGVSTMRRRGSLAGQPIQTTAA